MKDMVRGGFSVEAMKAAFDKVCNKQDWKAPIKAVIPSVQVPLVVAAIEFYTATNAKVTPMLALEGDYTYVSSVGYREGPAGP